MLRDPRFSVGLLASVLMVGSAAAQAPNVHWQHDIESAKATARQTGRLVLVHVWTENCGPCAALEQNVFTQPGFAAALEQRFVPVKLNANEYPGTAQGFGITRVPTDVILSPDGEVLDKTISPATPSAYLAQMNQVANQFAGQMGHEFQQRVAAAPVQPKVPNTAYAGLNIGAPPPSSTPQPPAAQQQFAQQPAPQQPFDQPQSIPAQNADPANPYNGVAAAANSRYAMTGTPTPGMTSPPAMNSSAPDSAQPSNTMSMPNTTPPVATNHATVPSYNASADRYATPPAQTMNSTPPSSPTPPPATTNNQYATAAPTTAPATPSAPLAQNNAAASDAASDSPELPSGSPPLAFEGYCPVTMRTNWQWVKGDPKWGAVHRGRTYLFASQSEQQQFLANPDYYSPALSGLDPVMAIDHKQSVQGLREHSLDYDNQFYFFSSEATLEQFTANPQRYANGVRQAMGLPPIGGQVR